LRIPSGKKTGQFANEIYSQCTASKKERLQRGAMFRNLYLTGSEDGNLATYNEIFPFIENLAAFLYSPVELRFTLDKYGSSNPRERAIMRSATSDYHKQFRRGTTDTLLSDATIWALNKGKTFIKNGWTSQGFKDMLVQPEMMGVLEENLGSLDDQDAFCHTTYLTPDKLYRMLRTHPEREDLMRKATKYVQQGVGSDDPEHDNTLRQIVVGGMQPYQIQGQGNPNNRGQVRWMDAPVPQFAPEVISSLIPIHELWIWDDERDNEKEELDGEYTTIQFIGEDVVLFGDITHRNLFADQYSPDDKRKKSYPSGSNPLAGHHPFSEICPNPLDGYFWGLSEIFNVALLQKSITARVDGINQMLRRQEDPPKFFSGTGGIKQAAYSIMKKAGGYLTDSNPAAKATDLYPQLPEKIFESLHEFLAMFDRMAGMTPTMSGRGESGVRSQGHSDALTKNASPRFKERALGIERQIEAMGGKKLDMLKAHVPYSMEAWVPQKEAGIQGAVPVDFKEQPPVPGTVPVEFTFYDLPDDCKVLVDSHSSSPAFSQESQTKIFDALKMGLIDPEYAIEHLHLPSADSAIESLQIKKAEAAAFAQAHPEEAAEQANKSHKKK
jgi:hypothetical protein